ncbi:hypothetical protein ACSPAH_23290 [Buttiauxella agrestis]
MLALLCIDAPVRSQNCWQTVPLRNSRTTLDVQVIPSIADIHALAAAWPDSKMLALFSPGRAAGRRTELLAILPSYVIPRATLDVPVFLSKAA